MATWTEASAATFLAALKEGEPVILTDSGRDLEPMVVIREYQRADGDYGHPHGGSVVVGFGVGRYCTNVSAPRMAAGMASLRRVKEGQ